MAQWAELEAFTRTIDLDPRVLNGSVTEEVDLQKLYYIYVSSKPDDWNFILQTRGLGRHVKDFAAIEPSWGQHSPAIELPDFDIDQIDHLFDIHRSPDQATQRALHLSKLVVPEVVEIDGVPMHLEIQLTTVFCINTESLVFMVQVCKNFSTVYITHSKPLTVFCELFFLNVRSGTRFCCY